VSFLRKMRIRSYINKLRSESKLVNNINNKFKTKEKEIMLIYGDWGRTSQMRGCISVPSIGIKRRLNEDFEIMNFDEFRTSCLDHRSLMKNKNISVIDKQCKRKQLHSVLVSTIPKTTDNEIVGRTCFQNRNRNAVKCFKIIVDSYREKGEKPEAFRRSTKMETLTQKL